MLAQKKRYVFVIITFFLGLFFLHNLNNKALAQAPTASDTSPIVSTQNWQCLTPGEAKLTGCVRESGIVVSCDGSELPLTGHCDPANEDAYLVACADTNSGIKCSTGVNQYDDELNFGQNNATRLRGQFSVEFPSGAKTRTTDGRIATTVITHTPTGQERTTEDGGKLTERTFSFFCVTKGQTVLTDPTGRGNTLQYGSFGFEGQAACLSVRADPYGTVFDSQSLEPLSNVSVALSDASNNKLQLPGITNPVTTLVDGLFNFLVESGTYYLSPVAPAGYSFTDQSFIHPNYTKAYANLYKTGAAIVEEAGKPEHRDIALNPGVNPPHRAAPVNMNYGSLQLGTAVKITGKQSHPLTVVSFKQGDKEIATTTADKYGFYEAMIKNGLIDAAQLIDVYLTKVDLTASEQTSEPKKAISIEPQPPYIEGKATNKSGTVIPNAQVKVKLTMSDKVYSQTNADAGGIFIVMPKDVPALPYYLEITPPNSFAATKLTMSEFATINKEYLTTNNINLMTAVKNGKALITENKINQPPNSEDTSKQTTNLPLDNTNGQPAPANNMALVLGIVVFFILFVIGAGIYIYMKQKNPSAADIPQPPTPPQG